MAVSLTKRERVGRAMACQETDRVPLYDLLFNDAATEYYDGLPLPEAVPGGRHRHAQTAL